MKKEILSIVLGITIFFSVIGCGGSDTTTKTNETKVKIAFESQKGTVFEKVSDITKVLIDVKKDGTFIYEEKSARKINGSWSATLNLNSNNAPYSFTTRAYKGDELLYKGDFISTETLPTSLLLTLDEVSVDTSFSLLPSLKKIETSFLAPIRGEDTAKKIRMKFTIVNLQSDSVDYSLLAIRKAINVKGQLVEVGDAGSFNPNAGALNFTNENELIFESVYTQPVNPPDESTSSDVFTGGTKDFISTSLLLTNSKGNVVTIPFTLPTYEEQTVSINFPPEVQKVDVLDEGEEHTIKVILSDADNATFTYEWEVLTGSTIVGATAIQNALKLKAYDVTSNNSLCVRVKVSDIHGASTKVGYCLHGTGLVREGNIVTDVVRKLQWQDDEAVKTNSRAWLEVEGNNFYKGFDPITGEYTPTGDTALPYCKALELDGYLDWRVPTKEELKTIVDKRFDPIIAENFINIGVSTAENPNIYYTTATPAKYIDEHGMYKDMLPFSQNGIDDNWDSYYVPKDKIYVRCIRDKNITISNLEDIYGALKLTTSLDKQVYSQTDTIERLYTFKNESNHILNIPENTTFSRPLYTVGTLQFWIERLGSDSTIPSAIGGRSDNKYGADGFRIFVSNNVVNPLAIVKSSSFNYSLKNHPKGNYRMYVDYQKVDGSLIETQSLDFTIE